jgi:hypothetical protein
VTPKPIHTLYCDLLALFGRGLMILCVMGNGARSAAAESANDDRRQKMVLSDFLRDARAQISNQIESKIETLLKGERHWENVRVEFNNSGLQKALFSATDKPLIEDLPGLGGSWDPVRDSIQDATQIELILEYVQDITVTIRIAPSVYASLGQDLVSNLRGLIKDQWPRANPIVRLEKVNGFELHSDLEKILQSSLNRQQGQQKVVLADRLWEKSLGETIASFRKNLNDIPMAGNWIKDTMSQVVNGMTARLAVAFVICLVIGMIGFDRSVRKIADQLKASSRALASSVEQSSQSSPLPTGHGGSDLEGLKSALEQQLHGFGSLSLGGTGERNEELRRLVADDLETMTYLAQLLMSAGDFKRLVVLVGALPKNIRESILTQSKEDPDGAFKAFMQAEGFRIFQNGQELANLTGSVCDLTQIARQDKAAVSLALLDENLKSLSDDALCQAIVTLDDIGQRLVVSRISNVKLAYLVSKGLISSDLLTVILTTPLRLDGAHRTLLTLTKDNKSRLIAAYKEVRVSLDPFLALNGQTSDAVVQRQEAMFNQRMDDVVAFVGALSVGEAAMLCAVLTPQLRQTLLRQLPDIKARRIQSTTYPITEMGLGLKAKLITVLEEPRRGPLQNAA